MCQHVLYRYSGRTCSNMVPYVLPNLSLKDALTLSRLKWKRYLFYIVGKTNNKSLLDLLCTCPSLYIDEQVYHLWDVFGLQVSEQAIKRMLKRVKWSKKWVSSSCIFPSIFGCFLTYRCKYMLHNVIQNSGKSGCVNWLHIQRISLCLLTNRLQMREQAIENAVGLLTALHLTNTES